MSEDITFCASDCDILTCERNKRNIQQPREHSFAALEGTVYCEKEEPVSEYD